MPARARTYVSVHASKCKYIFNSNFRFDDQTHLFDQMCRFNTSKTNDYRRDCSKYAAMLNSYEGVFQLPPEFDIDPLPNLGPKVNHHFKHNNTEYVEVEHPIWGLILGLLVSHDVKKGEELFANYDYGLDEFPLDYPWYHEQRIAYEREERLKAQ